MAKIAQCGYGSQGEGLGRTTDGYAYVVNDNVRTGDILQVISTARNGKKFATTAKSLHTYKQGTEKGIEAEIKGIEAHKGELTEAYTGKELGATGSRRVKEPALPEQKQQSLYTMQTRAEAIGKYMKEDPSATFTQNAYDTFETYSKQFMRKENNE